MKPPEEPPLVQDLADPATETVHLRAILDAFNEHGKHHDTTDGLVLRLPSSLHTRLVRQTAPGPEPARLGGVPVEVGTEDRWLLLYHGEVVATGAPVALGPPMKVIPVRPGIYVRVPDTTPPEVIDAFTRALEAAAPGGIVLLPPGGTLWFNDRHDPRRPPPGADYADIDLDETPPTLEQR